MNTKHTSPQKRHWLSLATFCAMGLLAVGSVDSEEDTKRVKTSEPVEAISSHQLYSQYEANEVEADNRYKGKIVAVSGTIGDIGKDLMDQAYVLLSSGDPTGMFGVQCFFDESEESSFSSIRSGQQVTIKGQVEGKFGNVLLKNCSFQ
jgi:hypothetical protein